MRPWRHQSGGIGDEQLERVTSKLRLAAPGVLRVVALHHQLIGAPWRSRKKPVARRNHVLARLVDSGADLIVGGHIHQATVSERHEFEVITGDARGVVVSIAPGLGQPRPKRLGEARGCIVYSADERTLIVDTYIWRDDDWGLTATRRFPRGREPLAGEATARTAESTVQVRSIGGPASGVRPRTRAKQTGKASIQPEHGEGRRFRLENLSDSARLGVRPLHGPSGQVRVAAATRESDSEHASASRSF